MISMAVYDGRKKEHELMEKLIRHTAARMTDQRWQLDFFEKLDQLDGFIKNEPLLDLLCYDVTAAGGIPYLKSLRRKYSDTSLMLIADASISPMEYIRPSILASALLLRPFSSEQVRESLEAVLQAMDKKQETEERTFLIENREGKTYIPMSQIYYFEAREKRIYVRLKREEYTFYDTIEHLTEQLPEEFIRCHRSFIVSRSRIQKVMLSKNRIILEHNIEVPLSRSYKAVLKELE